MFAFSTIEPDVSSWNMSSALYLDHMFKNNKKANPDVAKWNISDVIDLQEVFCNILGFPIRKTITANISSRTQKSRCCINYFAYIQFI